MAITGTGTQGDPWIVHDISEIRSTISESGKYLKLANDINCNDYGVDFTWETLSSNADFDLDGHSIKNIEIPLNQKFSNGSSGLIHNGKILNAFLNDSTAFSENTKFTEMSLSIDATAQNIGGYGVIQGGSTRINSCAIYIRNCKKGAIHDGSGTQIEINDSDIFIDNPNVECVGTTGSGFWNTLVGAKCINSRIRGNIKKLNVTGIFTSLQNCVIDLEVLTPNISSNIAASSVSTTPINTEVISVNQNLFNNGFIKCTTSEIRNGDALRAKGFLVVNVVGD